MFPIFNNPLLTFITVTNTSIFNWTPSVFIDHRPLTLSGSLLSTARSAKFALNWLTGGKVDVPTVTLHSSSNLLNQRQNIVQADKNWEFRYW